MSSSNYPQLDNILPLPIVPPVRLEPRLPSRALQVLTELMSPLFTISIIGVILYVFKDKMLNKIVHDDENDLDKAQRLLYLGADPNAESLFISIFNDTSLKNLLQYSVTYNKLGMAKVLLDAGADPNYKKISVAKYYNKNDSNITLLYYRARNSEAFEPLEENFDHKKIYTELSEPEDITLLHYMVRHKQLEACKLLIEHGSVDLNDNFEALRDAVADGQLDIVDLLLEHGMQPIYSKSLFLLAAGQGRTDIIETLLKHGASADINLDLKPLSIFSCSAVERLSTGLCYIMDHSLSIFNLAAVELLLKNGAYFQHWVQNLVPKLLIEDKDYHGLAEKFLMIEYYSQQKYNDILHGNLEDICGKTWFAGDILDSAQV